MKFSFYGLCKLNISMHIMIYDPLKIMTMTLNEAAITRSKKKKK